MATSSATQYELKIPSTDEFHALLDLINDKTSDRVISKTETFPFRLTEADETNIATNDNQYSIADSIDIATHDGTIRILPRSLEPLPRLSETPDHESTPGHSGFVLDVNANFFDKTAREAGFASVVAYTLQADDDPEFETFVLFSDVANPRYGSVLIDGYVAGESPSGAARTNVGAPTNIPGKPVPTL